MIAEAGSEAVKTGTPVEDGVLGKPSRFRQFVRQHWRALGALLLVGVFQVATIRDGHGWGDDFAQYILHARNLVAGRPYAQTGYLINPEYELPAPAVYPPGTPAMLAPVYAVFGPSLRPMKAEMVLFLLVSLGAVYALFTSRLSRGHAALLILLLGFSPVLWEFKDQIGSDLIFVALCYVTLVFAEVVCNKTSSPGSAGLGALLGLFIYLSFATRSVGIVLIAVVLVYATARHRRVPLGVFVATLVALSLVVLQRQFVPAEESYGRWLLETLSPTAPLEHVMVYASDLRAFFLNGYNRTASVAVWALMGVLGAVGFWTSVRRQLAIHDCFLLMYAGTVVLFPPVLRYLFPVVPIYFFYSLKGLEALTAGGRGRAMWVPTALLAGVIASSYAGAYSISNFGPIQDGATQPAFLEACDFIKRNTSEEARFIFRKPKALALFGGRAAAAYNPDRDATQLPKLVQTIHASYVVVADLTHPDFNADRTVLLPFVTENPDSLTKVFANARFSVYQIVKQPRLEPVARAARGQ